MDKKNQSYLDYDEIVENALRSVVRESLEIISKNGLKNNHYFYISFSSKHNSAIVPKELLKSDEEEIKIILQHQFWDLNIYEDKFSVTLSFSGKKKKIVVPFNAIFSFSDPSVGFGLQFKNNIETNKKSEDTETKFIANDKKALTKVEADILSLDDFRSKKVD